MKFFRICKSSTKYIDFVNDVKLLVNKLFNQKFSKNLVYSCLNKSVNHRVSLNIGIVLVFPNL